MHSQINCLVTSNNAANDMSEEVNKLDEDGNNVLHYLMMYFDTNSEMSIDKANELIDQGINTNQYNDDNFTPLHIAIKYKQIKAVKF